MKNVLAILITSILSIAIVSAQTPKKAPKAKKSVKTSASKETFEKNTSSDSLRYFIYDSVEITNGHDQKVKIKASGSFPKASWAVYVESQKISDKEAFQFAIIMLALKAQYSLKNTQSFEPLPKQFFAWDDENNSFMCDFKMMGRNGYGNLIETSELVFWSPSEK